MKRNLIAFTDPDGNWLNFASTSDFKRAIKDFGEGVKLSITLEKWRPKRSPSQNNLLHMYLNIISEYTGQDIQTIKDVCKLQFGIREAMLNKDGEEIVDQDTGEIVGVFKSTSEYTTLEMTIFIDELIKWGVSTFHLSFPDPEDLRNNSTHVRTKIGRAHV